MYDTPTLSQNSSLLLNMNIINYELIYLLGRSYDACSIFKLIIYVSRDQLWG